MNANDYVSESIMNATMTRKEASDMAYQRSRALNLKFAVCKVPNEERYWVTKYFNDHMIYYYDCGELVNS